MPVHASPSSRTPRLFTLGALIMLVSLVLAAGAAPAAEARTSPKAKAASRCVSKHTKKCSAERRAARQADRRADIARKHTKSTKKSTPFKSHTSGHRITVSQPPEAVAPPVSSPTPPVTTTVGEGVESVESLPVLSTPSSVGPFEMGVVPGSLASSEPETINQLGAHSVRMEFEIDEPASQLASTIEEYAKVGIRVMPLAGFEGTIPTPAEAANLASWAAAYGPGGSFWKGKTFPADTAMTDIEFGNETSYTYQFANNSEAAVGERAQAYALRFKEAEERIHAVDPAVGLLAQGDSGENHGATWVNNMFKAVPNLAQLVAGWTVHPYGPEAIRRIEEVVTQTAANGAPSTVPIYVTEWGLASDNGRCLSDNYGWNPCMSYTEAATDLASTVAAMSVHFGARLRALYLYQAQDLAPSQTTTNREEYFGALQQDGARKGAYTTEVEALLHANV